MKKILISLALALAFGLINSVVFAQEELHFGQIVDRQEPVACLVCHEGIKASEARFCKSNCNITASHPAFKKYPPAGKDHEFNPVEKLTAAGIDLRDGEITCVSCHDLGLATQYFLVISRENGQLCKTCHLKFWER
ncbi:MAG: cytochrome C [Proteobacteria bacterium]|nr:cytochrome C [Pseudomonadota bacterium]MBU1716234.1 cytochrome C [Pseudomonadota bacterium]